MRSFQESRDTLSHQSLLLGPFRLKCPIFHSGTLPQRHISLFLHSNQVSGFFSRRNKFPHMSKVKMGKKASWLPLKCKRSVPSLSSPQGTRAPWDLWNLTATHLRFLKKKHCLPEVPRSPVPPQYLQDGFQSRKQGCVNQMHTGLCCYF